MSVSTQNLDRLCEIYKIQTDYKTISQQKQSLSVDSKLALLRACGVTAENNDEAQDLLDEIDEHRRNKQYPSELVIPELTQTILHSPDHTNWTIIRENDGTVIAEGQTSTDIEIPPIEFGIYFLDIRNEQLDHRLLLLVEPIETSSISQTIGRDKIWGINSAFYALKSSRNLGIGDYDDLAELLGIVNTVGASFVGINPLHALGFSADKTISPYSPTHRRWLNSDHLAIDSISRDLGYENSICQPSQEATRSQLDSTLIEYSAVREIKHKALENLYVNFVNADENRLANDFREFKLEHHETLKPFSLFETLAEMYGSNFRTWPRNFHNAASLLSTINGKNSTRVDFHCWLQWIAQRQLGRVTDYASQLAMPVGLYLDLAVGARLGGAEHWCELDNCAKGVSLGAPPDALSPDGQNWELFAYDPSLLSKIQFKPFIDLIRFTVQHCKLLRIDHVLGLTRSFWVPETGEPGGYITQPEDVFIAILKIEAKKASTVIIGEDLGLVPDGFREKMQNNGIYGYSVWQFERDKAGNFHDVKSQRKKALSCFATHDTPTLAGFSTGTDISWWHKLGWIDANKKKELELDRAKGMDSLLKHCQQTSSSELVDDTVSEPESVSKSIHQALASSPAEVVSIQLDDLLNQRETQNLPGTIDEHPNWRRRYTQQLSDLGEFLEASDIQSIMQNSDRNP